MAYLLAVLFASAGSFTPSILASPAAPRAPAAPADLAAPPADAVHTASGLAYKVLVAGSGTERARPTDRVVVNYSGWTQDGTCFDSTALRGQPADFPLNALIPGWVEGIQLMAPGSTVRMWIPVNLAYRFAPGMPLGNLVFDVELLKIVKAPQPMPVPLDVAAPPAGTATTASGLAWRVLTAGTGTEHPGATASVEVVYAAWTTDGKPLDPTGAQRAQMDVATALPGVSEALQRMVVGERTRFWLPPDLIGAHATRALTFDIELVAITKK